MLSRVLPQRSSPSSSANAAPCGPFLFKAEPLPGDHSLRDRDLRRLRALRFIEERIKGKSVAKIAKEFNVSDDTVTRTLTWAKKAQLVVEAEDRILSDILPAAHETIKRVMAGDNLAVAAETALEIYKGTLPSFSKRPSGAGASPESSDLASYITKLRDGLLTEGEVIDAPALSGGAQRLLPATAESTPAESLPEADSGPGSTADEAGDPSPRKSHG